MAGLMPFIAKAITLDLQVPIPGLDSTLDVTENTLGQYVRAFYVWFVGVAGIIAVVMIMWAGVRWITAAGNQSRIESAKTTMNGAVVGLIILLSSYLLLTWINPGLISLRIPGLTKVNTVFSTDVFCENLNGAQFVVGAPVDTGTGWKCNNEYNVNTKDGRSTGETCIGRTCADPSETCAWTGDSKEAYKCFNPKDACQSLLNPQSQNDCDRAQDTSSASGRTHICRFQKNKCVYAEVLNGCQAIADYYGLASSPAEWTSCSDCVNSSYNVLGTGGELINPVACQQIRKRFAADNRLAFNNGECKEPGDLTGAVGIDAVCCRFFQPVSSFTKAEFKVDDLACYEPF